MCDSDTLGLLTAWHLVTVAMILLISGALLLMFSLAELIALWAPVVSAELMLTLAPISLVCVLLMMGQMATTSDISPVRLFCFMMAISTSQSVVPHGVIRAHAGDDGYKRFLERCRVVAVYAFGVMVAFGAGVLGMVFGWPGRLADFITWTTWGLLLCAGIGFMFLQMRVEGVRKMDYPA